VSKLLVDFFPSESVGSTRCSPLIVIFAPVLLVPCLRSAFDAVATLVLLYNVWQRRVPGFRSETVEFLITEGAAD
jgi:hypothetical protein